MTKPVAWISVTILLAAPWVATLWTTTYNRTTPSVGGFPFFYWYQLLWIPISVVCTTLAYLLVRRMERSRRVAEIPAGNPRPQASAAPDAATPDGPEGA